jgi:hypothetical protein
MKKTALLRIWNGASHRKAQIEIYGGSQNPRVTKSANQLCSLMLAMGIRRYCWYFSAEGAVYGNPKVDDVRFHARVDSAVKKLSRAINKGKRNWGEYEHCLVSYDEDFQGDNRR